MLFKSIITLAVILKTASSTCAGAKKSSLRQDEINDYQRVLSDIVGHDTRKLAATTSPMNAPKCLKPGFVVANRLTGTAAATNIRFVYTGLRSDFYKLLDSIINGKLTGVPAELAGIADPTGLGAPGLSSTNLFNGGLNIQQQMYRVANLLGNAARLVFHDAGEVDIRTADKFGSDGCLSDSGPNSGLKEVNTIAMTVIEPLWQKYCDKISRADFWVLFAKIALESGLPDVGRFDQYVSTTLALAPGGIPGQNPNPYLDIPFQYGRKDAVGNCDAGAGRLPEHQPGLTEFERVYAKQMGLTIRDGVVLSGAHSVGHVHTQFSGFGHPDTLDLLEQAAATNAWDETPWIFDNLYFASVALEPWLNEINTVNKNVIPNLGGTNHSLPAGSIPNNAGANYWVVQTAPGVPATVPACEVLGQPNIPGAPAIGQPATCGLTPFSEIYCTYKGVTHTGPRPLATAPTIPIIGNLATFANSDPLNPCNCVSFFTIPQNGAPANCAMAPHPQTIMLNADLVPNFPISSATSKNVVDTPAFNAGKGLLAELCGPAVTNYGTAVNRPARFNTNEAISNTNLAFPVPVLGANGQTVNQGFGCVLNSVGDAEPNNQQTMDSSLLPKDPMNTAVSLWETVQSFMPAGVGACVEGISTFNGLMNPYGGSVKKPANRFIGQNLNSFAVGSPNAITAAQCTDPTPAFGNGRDNFYREFEIAFTKMTTVGFTYTHRFPHPRSTSFTDRSPQTAVPPLPAVTNRAINGIEVFRNPRTLKTGSITIRATGNGKLGQLTDIDLGRSTCTRAYPLSC